MGNENNIIIYQDKNEVTRVSVRFADEDLWLTQAQLATDIAIVGHVYFNSLPTLKC